MSKKVGISIADLQQGSKGLQRAPETEKKSNKFESQMREDSIDQLIGIYEKHDGDLDLIFEELDSNPEKAKKPHNRPKSSREFAEKFLDGFYALVKDEDEFAADSKSHK